MKNDLIDGHLYQAQQLGESIVLVEKGDLAQLVQDAKFWWDYRLGRLFFCEECQYCAASAQAVQEHSEREHDCRFETYYTTNNGVQRVRVKTIKCHNRVITKQPPPLRNVSVST